MPNGRKQDPGDPPSRELTEDDIGDAPERIDERMERRMNILDDFVERQRALWPMADKNFKALAGVRTKTLTLGGETVRVQFNPDRIISSAAKTDKASLSKRPCFLCPAHRFPEQIFLPVITDEARCYDILLNPFPIFPQHLVVALSEHRDQGVLDRLPDLLFLTHFFNDYTFFYNGPSSGASAPDHHHFQACPEHLMPIEQMVRSQRGTFQPLARQGSATMYHHEGFYRGIFVIEYPLAATGSDVVRLFHRLMAKLPVEEGESEPRINLVSFKDGTRAYLAVILRKCHRSHHFYSSGEDHLLMSPGCADMAGYFITPMEEDYEKLNDRLLAEMVDEITVPPALEKQVLETFERENSLLSVGILSAPTIRFELQDGRVRTATYQDGKIEYEGRLHERLFFEASGGSTASFLPPFFTLYDVTIGKQFHWEQNERQTFAGSLEIIVEDGQLTAVNHLPVEDYLLSVIASEMSAEAPLELLKAHAVISRSWVLRMKQGLSSSEGGMLRADLPWERDYEKWYGGGSHRFYDVCADDHCQRYQGLTRLRGTAMEKARLAVSQTAGQVLAYPAKRPEGEKEICDTRFYKCCGGHTELFSTCWEEEDKPYLASVEDPYCAQATPEILAQVLNDYDVATRDWYQWEERYSREEISQLIAQKSGYTIGTLQYIKPLETGPSGRHKRIALCGDQRSLIVGKELEIRRLLSLSHLKSSAFEVTYEDADGKPVELKIDEEGNLQTDWSRIVLRGKGWGHGVGLCQIGAAVMASQGLDYRQILAFYYPGSRLA
ncbi:MAG: DUF4922 domain-containing protein [Bacteroidales bacterium]|nr:DUF4922 domain-containing protein [Bacteroidales bacterium]